MGCRGGGCNFSNYVSVEYIAECKRQVKMVRMSLLLFDMRQQKVVKNNTKAVRSVLGGYPYRSIFKKLDAVE